MAKQILELTVSKVIQERGDTKTFHIEWAAGTEYTFKTGQFITVYLPEEPQTKRAYSLSSCALDRGYFEITVKRAGYFGEKLNEVIKEGSKLVVIPPVGKFNLPDDQTLDLVMVAGGSGVTPFRGFFRDLTYRKLPTHGTILYSVRTPDEIIFEDEFRALEKQNPNLHFKVTCTRATPEKAYQGMPWPGRHGRIDAAWVKENIRDVAKTVFYACGPNELVDATEQLVVNELAVPKEQMRKEKWG